MSKAIRIHKTGGPEVMVWEAVPTPEPGPGQALIRHEAVGLNYIDVYYRDGRYKLPALPAVIGQEAAGTVLAVGADVTLVAPGDRVAYSGALGAYATERVIAADRLVRLPPGLEFPIAAKAMLQGMTAEYLLRRTYAVQPGDPILVYAAAGGVGSLLCQWGAHLGATVIGVVSTEAKAALARQNGAAHVILGHGAVAAEVKRITDGAMVPVVYDSVGAETFQASLASLAPRGLMVSYGNSSGPVPPVDLAELAAKGSLFITRPSLATYVRSREELERTAAAVFEAIEQGYLEIQVNQTFALKDAAEAHRALEARLTTGATVLIP